VGDTAKASQRSNNLAGEELRPVTEPSRHSSKPLGYVWLNCDPYSVMTVGLKRTMEERAQVYVGRESPGREPSFAILCWEDAESVSESIRRSKEAHPDASILVFGPRVDLPLARAALRAGARGFVHAGMRPEQILRAIGVAAEGEIVAPRKLLEYLIANEEHADVGALSARQREILGLVVEGLSNAEIAKRLYLSESTIKQHLRAAYKLLGVSNRTEAARLIRNSD
jgi:DNA-binding NarL/FixJ family response regulator